MEKKGRFSSYAILSPVTYFFKKEPLLTWKFKPATSRDELAMTTFSTSEGSFETGGVMATRYPNIIEIMYREIAVLFAGSNIPSSEIPQEDLEKCVTQEDVDKLVAALPRLSDNANIDLVEELLGSMPHEMVVEIWTALGEANLGWGPRKEKKAK